MYQWRNQTSEVGGQSRQKNVCRFPSEIGGNFFVHIYVKKLRKLYFQAIGHYLVRTKTDAFEAMLRKEQLEGNFPYKQILLMSLWVKQWGPGRSPGKF
jgi:hypothetical protein